MFNTVVHNVFPNVSNPCMPQLKIILGGLHLNLVAS